MKLHFAALLALGLAALSTGCGRPFVSATPPGFVELDELYEGDEYRAATADGVDEHARINDWAAMPTPFSSVAVWAPCQRPRRRHSHRE